MTKNYSAVMNSSFTMTVESESLNQIRKDTGELSLLTYNKISYMTHCAEVLQRQTNLLSLPTAATLYPVVDVRASLHAVLIYSVT